MIVEVKDLKAGDDILFSSGSSLKMVRLIKDPEVKCIYPSGDVRYKTTRCLANIEEKTFTRNYYNWKTKQSEPYSYTKKVWHHNLDEASKRVSVDLSYKDIWLLKRNEE